MAVIYLTGVYEDGVTPRAPWVPENVRQELALTQATSNQIIIQVSNPGGVPVAALGELILTVKQKPQDEPALARLVGTWTPMLGAGTAMFTWPRLTMDGQPWGRYVYDVKWVNGSEVNVVIPASPFRLAPAV